LILYYWARSITCVAGHPAEVQDITSNGNLSKVIGEEQNLNNPADWQFGWATYLSITGIGSSLTNRFTNNADWQFSWPTGSPILHIQQYIQFGN